ncbi:DUF6403 family protein [Micromonospora eburnea]|uniref:Uncharacterized protein n=1 Tax=Micromonospora eburnea TaxID=227316 RepID=A0A1C6US33_9ACTN|nr:DUF6403 family protein [Micromonospora eburnea]SCL56852.1 hypothetical protein GA0070604_3498 [Micromonospora eburnea]
MSPSVLIWLTGSVLLLAAGLLTTLLPRRRSLARERRIAWSAAGAAIDSAAVSRDASAEHVPEAERLLARAELLAASGGGATAARTAAGHARRADELWRAHQ